MDSNYQKIRQHKFALELMRDNTLPFDCYYINNAGLKMRPYYFKWLVRGFEEIERAIKERREPNFTFLLDHKTSGIYQFVLPPVFDDVDAKLLEYLESGH